MPNRIIKESICVSDSIDTLNWFEEVLFYRLIVNCVDYGRFDGRMAVIKNRLFPLKDNITMKSVKDGINKLASVGLVALYNVDGRPYLHLPTWNDHQNVRAKRSKYPEPVEHLNTSEYICNHVQANVPDIRIQSESNPNTNICASQDDCTPTKTKRFTPPTLEEVTAYCKERGNKVDPQRFIDFYESKGWMVGRTKMKDFKAAVRNWERNDYSSPQKQMHSNIMERSYAEQDMMSKIPDPTLEFML